MEQTQTPQSPQTFQPSHTGEMAVMGREGDTKMMWDKSRPVEVEVAKAGFDKLIKDGYSAYAVSDDGSKKGTPIKEFDPSAERLIMVPPMQAG